MVPYPRNLIRNFAGRSGPDLDKDLVVELTVAGIKAQFLPELLRSGGEVKTIVIGTLHGWEFKRLWNYWAAKGPGLPLAYAEPLHDKHGREVRVAGHCGCPSPFEHYKGFGVGDYHVDTSSGLAALAAALDRCVADAIASHSPLAEVEQKAREHYEAARKHVGGRPSWEKLNPNDAYDMGMRDHALDQARQRITEDATT